MIKKTSFLKIADEKGLLGGLNYFQEISPLELKNRKKGRAFKKIMKYNQFLNLCEGSAIGI